MFFQHVLHGQGIEHRGQHAHVVRRGTLHAFGRAGEPAKNIAAADDQGHLHAHLEHGADFAADGGHGFRVDAVFVLARQELRRSEFEQHALVPEVWAWLRLGKSC